MRVPGALSALLAVAVARVAAAAGGIDPSFQLASFRVQEVKEQCRLPATATLTCVFRADCSDRGECINGACVCDDPLRVGGVRCETNLMPACAIDCAALHRASCVTDHVCGACADGFEPLRAGASINTRCQPVCDAARCIHLNRRMCDDEPLTCGACKPGFVAPPNTDSSAARDMACVACDAQMCASLGRAACDTDNRCGPCAAGFVGDDALHRRHTPCKACAHDCAALNRDGCTSAGACGACLPGFIGANSAANDTACQPCPCTSIADCERATARGASSGTAACVNGRCVMSMSTLTSAAAPAAERSAAVVSATADHRRLIEIATVEAEAEAEAEAVLKDDILHSRSLYVSTLGQNASVSAVAKELAGMCGSLTLGWDTSIESPESMCAKCTAIKKANGDGHDCVWCPVSQVCVDAAAWETDAVKAARKVVAGGGEHPAAYCLTNSTDAGCYELGLSNGRGCSFVLSDGCSPAAALRLSAAALTIVAIVTTHASVDALWG